MFKKGKVAQFTIADLQGGSSTVKLLLRRKIFGRKLYMMVVALTCKAGDCSGYHRFIFKSIILFWSMMLHKKHKHV